MSENYRISFQVGDFKFEIESTDKEWVESKEKEYLERIIQKGKTISSKKETTKPVKENTIPPNITINEFYKNYIKANNITSRPNIAVLFVYYLQKVIKQNEIKTQDVTKCFGDIQYPNYNNINITDILRRGKKRALLNYVNDLWSLTMTGEDFILNSITSEK